MSIQILIRALVAAMSLVVLVAAASLWNASRATTTDADDALVAVAPSDSDPSDSEAASAAPDTTTAPQPAGGQGGGNNGGQDGGNGGDGQDGGNGGDGQDGGNGGDGQPHVFPGIPDGDIVIGEIDPGPSVTPGLLPDTVDGFAGAPGGGQVQVPLGSNDLKAGPGCAVQCITSGVALARGAGAKLTVTTDTPATIWLVATDGAGSTAVRQSDGATTTFSTLLDELEAGTAYDVTVAATDADGHTAHAYGSFTTLRRTAIVTFNHAVIVSSPSTSSVDAHIRVDGSWLAPAWSLPLEGSEVALGINWFELEDVDRYLDLFFQLAQHNGGSVCEPPNGWFPADGPGGTIESACRIFNSTAGVAIDLDSRPANATSWNQHTLELELGSPPIPLEFRVPVTIHVSYS